MALVMGSLQLGIIYGLLAIGIYITFRILNIPDLTCEGTFTLGLAISAVVTRLNHPYIAILVALVFGMIAGAITGLLQTKCKIHPILAGILVMSGLYPVNLAILGGSPNLSLMNSNTIFRNCIDISRSLGLGPDATKIAVSLIVTVAVVIILAKFFKTHTGLAIRATGDNEDMVRASSIDADRMKILALAIGNGVIAICGAMITQYQNYADINSGNGTLVLGLASVIIGEVIFFRRNITLSLVAAVVGSIVYRFIIALAMRLPFFDASYLKLVSAVIVGIALSLPAIKSGISLLNTKKGGSQNA
ncbi:MAG: ABC transporter permease [Clostridia bacterium]|nr:ABC transporter permease [Clostridia bacterium]